MTTTRTVQHRRAQGRTRALKDPRDLALLGTVLELQHEMPDGQALHHGWTVRAAPNLLWSPKRQALYIFPGLTLPRPKALRMPASAQEDPAAALQAWKTWSGRSAEHTRRLNVPKLQIQTAGQGHHIVYRSNKWGRRTDYIHTFAPGTLVDVDAKTSEGAPPSVLIVRGPPLRLTTRGLEG